MKAYRGVCFTTAACCAAAYGQLNQIEPVSELHGDMEYGISQVFPDQPEYSGMVLEDFVAGGPITSVALAFELSNPAYFANLTTAVTGWRISVYSSVTEAETTNDEFTSNTRATHLSTTPSYSGIGSVNGTTAFRVDFNGLNINAGTGLMWIGVAAIMASTTQEQVFLLKNTAPASLGGGAINNAVFLNPGQMFGDWRSYELGENGAYEVTAVPEPTALWVLAMGLLANRRRVRGGSK